MSEKEDKGKKTKKTKKIIPTPPPEHSEDFPQSQENQGLIDSMSKLGGTPTMDVEVSSTKSISPSISSSHMEEEEEQILENVIFQEEKPEFSGINQHTDGDIISQKLLEICRRDPSIGNTGALTTSGNP